jgi:molybdopterin/thiamine biosynthesis adenylyltransferase
VWRCLWRAFDKNRLKVAAGGCGGRGLTADPNLMAMGIESFFLCTLLILLDLEQSTESEKRS